MPKPESLVYACVEVPVLGPAERDGSQPIVGKQKLEGPALVVRENADGSIDVAFYNNVPDKDNHSHIIGGGSGLKQGAPGVAGAWWVQ